MKLTLPLSFRDTQFFRAGMLVFLSGHLHTARDAAHKRMVEAIQRGESLPIDWSNETIYYTGPTPAKSGKPIGSCDPISSYRMDSYAPTLMDLCVRVMIGKGNRSEAFRQSMINHHVVYLQTVGGVGALLARAVLHSEIVLYPDLGPEAFQQLEVKDFPAIVTYDIYGGDATKEQIEIYKNKMHERTK